MKLIIDIPDEEYKTLSELSEKEKVNELSGYEKVIANGIPYEDRPQGDLISREDLKEALHNFFDGKVIDEPAYILRDVFYHIDSAQPVPLSDFKEGYKQAIIDGKTNYSRPQGEWTDLSTDGRHIGWIACSVCGQEPPNESNFRTNFCPNCGAKMKGGSE